MKGKNSPVYNIKSDHACEEWEQARPLLRLKKGCEKNPILLAAFFITETVGIKKVPRGTFLKNRLGQAGTLRRLSEGSIMVITFSSMKGGVGKSTDAVLLANNLAARGKKVLFFDMDTNNSSTIYYTMGIAEEFPTQNVAEALSKRSIEGCAVRSRIENVDIVPSSLRLFDIRSIDYHALKKALSETASAYDCIVIDTAPTYDNLVMNALYAADFILTPVQLDFFNLTTTRFLRAHLYDELQEQVEKWFIFYTFWKENHVFFEASLQSQFVDIFEREFDNILNVEVPSTPATQKYTQSDEKISVYSRMVGSKRLATAFNQLANFITGEEKIVQRF